MIEFKPITIKQKEEYTRYLAQGGDRGCEYSFANLYMWGRQQAAVLDGHLVMFSQFNRRSVYPFPVGSGDLKGIIDAIIADSRERGIPCRLTGLVGNEPARLEALYPGKFRFHWARDSFDYVYDIHALADLKGKKLQKKRNHFNRFQQSHPEYSVCSIEEASLPQVKAFLDQWFAQRNAEDGHEDFHMEQVALKRALSHWKELAMEGLMLTDGGEILAVTMGSPISDTVFDVHFEKAKADVDGAYAAINCEFARYLRQKYPALQYLNREDDLGLEGLRRAKLSYKPHHLVEKSWACLLEDGYDY